MVAPTWGFSCVKNYAITFKHMLIRLFLTSHFTAKPWSVASFQSIKDILLLKGVSKEKGTKDFPRNCKNVWLNSDTTKNWKFLNN